MHKLEQLLNLPESKEIVEETKRVLTKPTPVDSQPLFRDIDEMDKIAAALPFVKGLGDISDSEFDALADRATNAYDDLMDLGMNVEARYSGRVFEVAASMLKNAIDAKSAKIDKKLKMVELQLKKQKMDSDQQPETNMNISGEGFVVTDRNSLIEKLKNMK